MVKHSNDGTSKEDLNDEHWYRRRPRSDGRNATAPAALRPKVRREASNSVFFTTMSSFIITTSLLIVILCTLPQRACGFSVSIPSIALRSSTVETTKHYHTRTYLLAADDDNIIEDFANSQKLQPDAGKLSAFEGPTAQRETKDSSSNKKTVISMGKGDNLGGYDPSEKIEVQREVNVGDPQIRVKEKDYSVTSILKELAAIQQQGPQKYCILGTRHCSYLHQQIIELLAYAMVLSGNHVYTSGAGGTHQATIRGALRAERPDLLTVVIPQSMSKQPKESQELLKKVEDVIEMPQNDDMSLDVASRICNSYLLQQTDQLISFAFHESSTVIEATKEARKLEMLVTVLYLD